MNDEEEDTTEYEDDDIIEYDEDDDTDEPPSRIRAIAGKAIEHPRILFGSLSSLVGFVAETATHEPIWMLFGAGIALALGLTSEQGKALQAVALGADYDPGDSIAELSDTVLGEAPEDQSFKAKMARLAQAMRAIKDGKKNTSLPRNRVVKKIPDATSQGLTYDRIITWFESGLIDDRQLIRLSEHLQGRTPERTERPRDRDRHAAKDEHETASEADGAPQMEPLRPQGWDEKKEQQLIGAYLANGNQSKSLEVIGLSDTQRNRDYARLILKQAGLLKGKQT